MSALLVRKARPIKPTTDQVSAIAQARWRMVETGQWCGGQLMGRRWPIGCVALEITQRCNLDCTACYLSESSEAVRDLPLQEVFRRIDMIFDHYGPNTDVQITGGDPTLRRRADLVSIVRQVRAKGMRPTLFTNGIRAKRDLLKELAAAGLVDVAFHVDLTQQRGGFSSEKQLNTLRQEYIERVRGLNLPVMFNTTVFDGNIEQMPDLVAFFVRNSHMVRLASFQLQADTGRGNNSRRQGSIDFAELQRQIELGAKASLNFDAVRVGHARCNRSAVTIVANGKVYDMLGDTQLVHEVVEATAELTFDRQHPSMVVRAFVGALLTRPALALRCAAWLAKQAWRAKWDLLCSRGHVHKLSFFAHDFMDACKLEQERVDACVFSVATAEGPICMCLHNARRDTFILQPVQVPHPDGDRYWNPLSGAITASPEPPPEAAFGPISRRRS
jgi:7,8-dihydro-6-hydroxymethylpterin dimethyltransferase